MQRNQTNSKSRPGYDPKRTITIILEMTEDVEERDQVTSDANRSLVKY